MDKITTADVFRRAVANFGGVLIGPEIEWLTAATMGVRGGAPVPIDKLPQLDRHALLSTAAAEAIAWAKTNPNPEDS